MRPEVNRRLSFVAGLALVLALSAVLSACGEGGLGEMWNMRGMHDEMHGGGSRAPQTPVVADASQVTVEIRDFGFLPRDLTVTIGTTISWTNLDAVPHDATDGADEWGTGSLAEGESFRLTFDSPGSYDYLCTIHPNMEATLTVA